MSEIVKQSETMEDSEFLRDIPDELLNENGENFSEVYRLLEGAKDGEIVVVQLVARIKIALKCGMEKTPEATMAASKVIINAIVEAKEMVGYIDPAMIVLQLRERKAKLMGKAV